MAKFDLSAPAERLAFFDGQQLMATDLGGIDDYNRQLRWLHNQSLHQPGVGNGFTLTAATGDRQVVVGPGYALDALGREILLTRSLTVPVPPVAGDGQGGSVFFDLSVSYPADAELKGTETRQGICAQAGAVRLREEPTFCWIQLELSDSGVLQPIDPQLAADVNAALRIVLGRTEVLQCKLKQPISTAVRLSVRPVSQPYLAAGQQAVTWSPTTLPQSQQGLLTGPLLGFVLTATVDTAAAGFATTPFYTARVAGSRLLAVSDPGQGAGTVQVFLEPVIDISQATPTRFVVEAALLSVPFDAQLAFANFPDAFLSWQVAWMGLE